MAGRIFDDRGNRMSPSHARKRGIKYRYYLSPALTQGRAERAGSIRRVPAVEIEALVVKSVREHLKLSASFDDRSLVNTHVARVEVQAGQLIIQLTQHKNPNVSEPAAKAPFLFHGRRRLQRGAARFFCPSSVQGQNARPIRSETRATLVASIARGAVGLMNLSLIHQQMQKQSRREKAAAYVRST